MFSYRCLLFLCVTNFTICVQQSQKARIEWDVATAKNVLKVRETLETADPTAVELFNLLAAAVEAKESELINIMEKTLSEKRRTKLQ